MTESVKQYIKTRNISRYERDDFDRFIKKVGFVFSIPAIHLTGTNGKGSTAAFLASIYQKAGYKVGLFQSPYLDEINEMIAINGEYITDDDFALILAKNKEAFDLYSLSEFEIETYIALKYFQEQSVDIAMIEVGMGGDVDATNIITPILSIITNVSLEHTTYLGRSISEIAASKAGIIKKRVPVLIGHLEEGAQNAVRAIAKYEKAELHIVEEPSDIIVLDEGYSFSYRPYKQLRFKQSKYQIENACLAIEATKILAHCFFVSEENVKDGLLAFSMPCRFEQIDHVIFDGAHNPDAIEKLNEACAERINGPIHVIFACFKDKNYEKMLAILSRDIADVTITTFPHPRARIKDEYALFLDDYRYVDDCLSLLDEKVTQYKDETILVTGSLAFVAFMKRYYLHKGKR